MSPSQRLFLTVLVLVALALAATSKRLYRVRRSRPMALLISGGWLAVAAGVLVGPSGIGAIDREMLLSLTPLMMIGLGWIGMMIGLQARREVLRALPPALWRVALVDALVSVVVFGTIAWFLLDGWVRSAGGPAGVAWLTPAAGLLAACSIGWAMETRSLRSGATDAEGRLAVFIRASGGLAAVLAVGAFGLLAKLASRSPETGLMELNVAALGLKLAVSLAVAVLVGLLGRYALTLSGRDRSSLLAVFLGVVTLVAGVASTLGASPLFTAMLAGIVIANLAGSPLREFERFIFQAEHVVAALFAMFAGVLIEPAIGLWGLALAVAIIAARLALKPALLRFGVGREAASDVSSTDTAMPARSSLYAAPARQSPVAIAMAVGLTLAEPSVMNRRILAVVVLAGLGSALLPMAIALFTRSGAPAPLPAEESAP